MQQRPDQTLVSQEEKDIIEKLEANLQDFKAQKPTAKGYARYTRISRSLIQSLHRASERRLHQQYRELPSTADGYLHVHNRTQGACSCEV